MEEHHLNKNGAIQISVNVRQGFREATIVSIILIDNVSIQSTLKI